MKKTSKVSIDIYDADGELCECIGGPMDYEDVKEQMLEILSNDGIPVIRRHGKHEKAEPDKGESKQVVRAALQGNREELAKALMDVLHIDNEGNRARPAPADMEVSKFLPTLLLKWEFEGVKFEAVGKYDDVMDAQAEFLDSILEED